MCHPSTATSVAQHVMPIEFSVQYIIFDLTLLVHRHQLLMQPTITIPQFACDLDQRVIAAIVI